MLTLYRVSPIILIAHPATALSGVWPRRGEGIATAAQMTSARKASCKVAALHSERQIETESVAQLRDLASRGALAKHRLDRVAGNDVNEQKDRRQNRPKSRQREQEE